MYLELLITASGAEASVAGAYEASDHMPEVGSYLLVLATTTIAFFENVDPPTQCTQVHNAFLAWQRACVEGLIETLSSDGRASPETNRRQGLAAGAYEQALGRLSPRLVQE
jgi:hypothetical protein